MTGRHVLFLSVSDVALYEKLEPLLRGLFPEKTFAFLGSTFAINEPWRQGKKYDLEPTSRLLWRWIHMNEFTKKNIVPAYCGGTFDVVVVHELGREAYHYAIRHADCMETLGFHKKLVSARLVEQGIRPPIYVTTRPTEPRLIEADREYFDDPEQRIHYLRTNTLDAQADEVVELVANFLCASPREQEPAEAALT